MIKQKENAVKKWVKPKNAKKQIDTIMAEFDFDKVRKVMVALNWRWWLPSAGAFDVPTSLL